MAKTGITYDLMTGRVRGMVQVNTVADLDTSRKVLKERGQGIIEVENKASIITERKNWYVENGRLKRKSDKVIVQEEAEEGKKQIQQAAKTQAEREAPINYLVEQLNDLRIGQDKSPIKKADMQRRIKELEKEYE